MAGLHCSAPSAPPRVFGILYAEDFDAPSERDDDCPAEPTPSEPAITQADVDAACAAAVSQARRDWQSDESQMRLKALAALGPTLAEIRDDAARSAMAVTEMTVSTILSIVTGLLPHFSREHGAAEVRALVGRLLPTIRSQTRINVRVHPDLVTIMQRDLEEIEPDLAAMIDIVAAPIERGDVKVSWENGSMARDTRKIMQAVEDALGQLGLHHPVEAPSKKRMAYAE